VGISEGLSAKNKHIASLGTFYLDLHELGEVGIKPTHGRDEGVGDYTRTGGLCRNRRQHRPSNCEAFFASGVCISAGEILFPEIILLFDHGGEEKWLSQHGASQHRKSMKGWRLAEPARVNW
jgi:hypothetical protein